MTDFNCGSWLTHKNVNEGF